MHEESLDMPSKPFLMIFSCECRQITNSILINDEEERKLLGQASWFDSGQALLPCISAVDSCIFIRLVS
jgi:hypothetical protein